MSVYIFVIFTMELNLHEMLQFESLLCLCQLGRRPHQLGEEPTVRLVDLYAGGEDDAAVEGVQQNHLGRRQLGFRQRSTGPEPGRQAGYLSDQHPFHLQPSNSPVQASKVSSANWGN